MDRWTGQSMERALSGEGDPSPVDLAGVLYVLRYIRSFVRSTVVRVPLPYFALLCALP